MRSPFAGNSYNMRLEDYTGGGRRAHGACLRATGACPAPLSRWG